MSNGYSTVRLAAACGPSPQRGPSHFSNKADRYSTDRLEVTERTDTTDEFTAAVCSLNRQIPLTPDTRK